MNFGREVARQTSCYTYVIEDEEPVLACKNVFEVTLMENRGGGLGFLFFKDASFIAQLFFFFFKSC